MGNAKSFLIQLHSVQSGSDLKAGTVFPTLADRVTIGRGVDCDVVLADPSVSAKHVVIESCQDGFVLRNRTRNGTTFINQQEVARGGEVEVSDRTSWLQVGAALLKVVVIANTVPVSRAMPLPSALPVPTGPRFLCVKLGRAPRIQVKGKSVSIFPSAARALARLAVSPGEVVDQDDLLTAMDEDFADRAGGLNLNQTMTYVRRLFLERIDSGEINVAELSDWIQACPGFTGGPLTTLEPKALCRALVANVRGVGYVLMLPPDAVQTEHR